MRYPRALIPRPGLCLAARLPHGAGGFRDGPDSRQANPLRNGTFPAQKDVLLIPGEARSPAQHKASMTRQNVPAAAYLRRPGQR